VNLAYDAEEFTESGAVGDPTAGPAEFGEALLTAAGAALSEVVTAATARVDER
jgi:creatinine amidohydrolase